MSSRPVRKWSNIFSTSAAPEVTTKLLDTSGAVAAPTVVSDGSPLRKGASRLQLVYVTSGSNTGTVSFKVWFWLEGCGWYLDDSLGAAGTVSITVAAGPTHPDQRALIIEYPGKRVAIEVTNASSIDLDIYAFDDIEEV